MSNQKPNHVQAQPSLTCIYQSSPRLPWMFNSSPHYRHKSLNFKIWQFGKEIQVRISFKKFFNDFDEPFFGHLLRIGHSKITWSIGAVCRCACTILWAWCTENCALRMFWRILLSWEKPSFKIILCRMINITSCNHFSYFFLTQSLRNLCESGIFFADSELSLARSWIARVHRERRNIFFDLIFWAEKSDQSSTPDGVNLQR